MKVIERRVYRGPSLYAHFPVMRVTIDLGALEAWPSARIPGFNAGLNAAMPSLQSHTCSYDTAGGFFRRLEEDGGTWLGHVFEHVAIELQQLTGAKVVFGKTRGEGRPGHYHVIYEYEEERVGSAAGDLALRLLHHLLPADLRPHDSEVSHDLRLRQGARRAHRLRAAPAARALHRRPWCARPRRATSPGCGSTTTASSSSATGRYQQRIQATVTSNTRHIAVEIASDKEETNRILGDLGLPVPRQQLARSAEAAVRAAERLGYPVVVKPLDANHGRGVSLDLKTGRRGARGLREGPRALPQRGGGELPHRLRSPHAGGRRRAGGGGQARARARRRRRRRAPSRSSSTW